MSDAEREELESLRHEVMRLTREKEDCELLLMECLQVLYDINEGNVREGSLH
jgi:hypothetical protein